MKNIRHISKISLIFVAFISLNAAANCAVKKQFQTINIIERQGIPEIEAKSESELCEVTNNKGSSNIKWVFRGLNCIADQCSIKFHGDESLLEKEKAYGCHGNANYYVCTLHVHKAKAFCDKHDLVNKSHCAMTYDVTVRGKKVDPTIIIKPRS